MKTNIKLQVTPEQSKRVQEICFRNGIFWNGEFDKNLSFLERPYLFIFKHLVTADITYDFKSDEAEEIDADLFIRTNGTCEEDSLEECQFAKYGFEKPDFECELLKEVKGKILGIVYNPIENGLIEFISFWWNADTGEINKNYTNRYDLTPIKKPWYKTCKFPCLVWDIVADKLEVVTHNINDTLYLISNIRDHSEVRLLTNDEIEGLKQ